MQGGQTGTPTPHIPCRSFPQPHLELGEAIWQPEWQWMKKPKAASNCFIGCQTLACLASVLAVPFPSSSVASRLLFKQRLESEGRVGTGLLAACQMLRDLILSPSYAPHSPWGSGAAAGHMPAGTVVGVGG